VSWFQTGARETGRKLDRLKNRVALVLERRRVRKAEIQLGWLGWQQADFLAQDIQEQVRKLHEVEQEQARLINAGAELAEHIRALQTEREDLGKKYDEAARETAAARQSLAGARAAVQARLSENEKRAAIFEQNLAEMRTQREPLSAEVRDLPPPAAHDIKQQSERLRVTDRLAKIGNEIAELERRRSELQTEARAIRQELATHDERLSALDKKGAQDEAAFKADDRKRLDEIRTSERERARLQKRADLLDREKSQPFLLIGQCLADNEIAPLNQPQALEDVRDTRIREHALMARIEQSAQESRQADVHELRTFYLAVALAVIVIVILAVALAAH
jgi:chromosome segregation ATPase